MIEMRKNFSSAEHQKADWLGIHEKICQLLIPLRTPVPFLGSEEERQHRKQQQVVRQVQLHRQEKILLVNSVFFYKNVLTLSSSVQYCNGDYCEPLMIVTAALIVLRVFFTGEVGFSYRSPAIVLF